jgi:hypothetical protein
MNNAGTNSTKLNFCTLFNSNYLSRGLVLFESLQRNCPDFHLYVFAFDDVCYNYLLSVKPENMTVVSLKEFEDAELLKVKPTRSAAEYCWTCTASTIYYSINTFKLENCTYVDADMCFYEDPAILLEEMGSRSVLITAHNYTPEYDQSAISGRYCVQFVTIKNDPDGMSVLKWWRDACIEWCYARAEDGKYGDQKYLDEFATRFNGVHELKHRGGGMAPWNVQQYTFKRNGEKITAVENTTGNTFPVVFFHFHGLKFFKDDKVVLVGQYYALTEQVKDVFYKPYIRELNKAKRKVQEKDRSFDANGGTAMAPIIPAGFKNLLKFYLYDLKSSVKNIFGANLRKRIANNYYYDNKDFNS